MKKIVFLMCIAACTLGACNKVKPPVLGNIYTIDKTRYTITVGCTVEDTGSEPFSEFGFCYNVGYGMEPTYNNCHRVVPADSYRTGYFQAVIAGLQTKTTYVIVAYVITSADTVYSRPIFSETLNIEK